MKRKSSLDRTNVPCSGKRAYVPAKGLNLEAGERDGACCVLVYVKQVAPRNKWEREFVHWCRKLGIQIRACRQKAEAVQPSREALVSIIADSGSAALECYGSPETLEALITLPCVDKWEWMLTGAPSTYTRASGAGEPKVIAKKKFPDPEPTVWTEVQNAMQEARREGETKRVENCLDRLAWNQLVD